MMRSMKNSMRYGMAAAALVVGMSSIALARDADDCKNAWSSAVRSYLTQNRKAAPDGKIPTTVDEAELAAQEWSRVFAPACALEAAGKKADARVEAALIGARILAKLDPNACIGFMTSYMQSSRAEDVCTMAASPDPESARKTIASSLPARAK